MAPTCVYTGYEWKPIILLKSKQYNNYNLVIFLNVSKYVDEYFSVIKAIL